MLRWNSPDEVWGKGFLAPEKFVAMLYGNIKR